MTGPPVTKDDRSSGALALRALTITAALSLAGSSLGLIAIHAGTVDRAEAVLIVSCVIYAAGTLAVLLFRRGVEPRIVAEISTVYFTLYLAAGSIIAIVGGGDHTDVLVYLVWYFPLLIFNKLVNGPGVARLLAKTILLAPLVVVVGFAPRLAAIFKPQFLIVIAAYCISHLTVGLTLDVVTRFREKYIVERERSEALKLESEVLERAQTSLREQAELLDKAQDAILVMDMDRRLIYWNKGAERLYGWSSAEVKGQLVADVFPAALASLEASVAALLVHGEWSGELAQSRRDGSDLIVESRCTLVRDAGGRPRSILAINTDITNRKAAEAKIQRLAFFDVLTELPNRLLLRERLEHTLAAALRDGSGGALLVIDLDDFKTLNDSLGHDTGDLLLTAVAGRLTACVRPTDTVARFGGDVFVVMVDGLSADVATAAAAVTDIAQTVLETFLAPYVIGSQECTITASIGITLFTGSSGSADDLLKQGDLAMYRAKARGRNAMCFFDPAMLTLVASRAALLADLRRAMEQHEFELHYQPQVDRQGRVIGAEALLRWPHPRRGMVSPAEFIPLAEEAGLIVDIGRWVLETACAQLARWASEPVMAGVTVAVNVSIRQFLDSDFVSLVLAVLEASGADPHRLKLEITESTMMEMVDDTIAKMTALKACSVGFSLDDFGTGYSSLSQLKRLPLDQLKIDQSFVRDVLTDGKDASIACTIITLGQNLNLSVIAEGVETQAQRDFLYAQGCYAYQGYLFSKALPAAAFEAFVAAACAADETLCV